MMGMALPSSRSLAPLYAERRTGETVKSPKAGLPRPTCANTLHPAKIFLRCRQGCAILLRRFTSVEQTLCGEMSELAEGARLEIVYAPKAYPGFESLPLRHFLSFKPGEVAERLNAAVSKTVMPCQAVSRVRIPASPPHHPDTAANPSFRLPVR